VITEGVEDALAAWALTTYPAWAALSGTNMADLDLPPEHRAVLILTDADEAGRKGAHDLARRLREEGRKVRVMTPMAGMGKDPNDVLLRRGRTA
jgi:DNA primase